MPQVDPRCKATVCVAAAIGLLALGSAVVEGAAASPRVSAPARSAKTVPLRGAAAPAAQAARGSTTLRAPGPATATISRRGIAGAPGARYPAPPRGLAPARNLASPRSLPAMRPANATVRAAGAHAAVAGVLGGPARYSGKQGGVLTGTGLRRRPTVP